MKEEQKGEIILYQSEEGTTKIEVRLENENVWLSQQQLTGLYQTSRTNVVEHIKHIFEEGELNEESTCRKFRQVQIEGNRSVIRETPFYNLGFDGFGELYNPDFKPIEFDRFRNEAGLNAFTMSLQKWIEATNAI